MWFIGIEIEQETSSPPPKKNPASAPATQKANPICEAPLLRSARRSFATLQKSRQNHHSYVWTEVLSGMVFVSAQTRSGILPCFSLESFKSEFTANL